MDEVAHDTFKTKGGGGMSMDDTFIYTTEQERGGRPRQKRAEETHAKTSPFLSETITVPSSSTEMALAFLIKVLHTIHQDQQQISLRSRKSATHLS